MMSEEAQEASNKIYKRVREHHTRKHSRTATTTDLMNRMLVLSDPVISSLRNPIKDNKKELPDEAKMLLVFDNDEESDDD